MNRNQYQQGGFEGNQANPRDYQNQQFMNPQFQNQQYQRYPQYQGQDQNYAGAYGMYGQQQEDEFDSQPGRYGTGYGVTPQGLGARQWLNPSQVIGQPFVTPGVVPQINPQLAAQQILPQLAAQQLAAQVIPQLVAPHIAAQVAAQVAQAQQFAPQFIPPHVAAQALASQFIAPHLAQPFVPQLNPTSLTAQPFGTPFTPFTAPQFAQSPFAPQFIPPQLMQQPFAPQFIPPQLMQQPFVPPHLAAQAIVPKLIAQQIAAQQLIPQLATQALLPQQLVPQAWQQPYLPNWPVEPWNQAYPGIGTQGMIGPSLFGPNTLGNPSALLSNPYVVQQLATQLAIPRMLAAGVLDPLTARMHGLGESGIGELGWQQQQLQQQLMNQPLMQSQQYLNPQRFFGQQSFRGVGPKGYVRSDERLKEDVSERLMKHPEIDASEISVDVRQGVVTLTGTVYDRYIKHQVEDLIENVTGVKDVENQITVRPRQSQEGTTATMGRTQGQGGSIDTQGQTGKPRH